MALLNRMYKENLKSLNWFVGCEHNCVYCKPSFQRQAKRQKQRCLKCYSYTPHAHLERLLKPPPKTAKNEFIFFPSMGDPVFANEKEWNTAIDYTISHPNVNFLIQSKNPECFRERDFPPNVILATTIETDIVLYGGRSIYWRYDQISEAPFPIDRFFAMQDLSHPKTMVTIEPILDFQLQMLSLWMQKLNPSIVYVGYDNHNCKLPEPPLAKTKELIKQLEKFTEVRVKTLRKAWWEN